MLSSFLQRYSILKGLWQPFTHSPASVYGAAACYYTLLSLPPAVILLGQLFSQFPPWQNIIHLLLTALVPNPFLPLIKEALQAILIADRPITTWTSFLLLFWSASKGLLRLTDGIFAVSAQKRPRYLLRRILAILWLALLLLLLPVTLLLLVFGAQLFTGMSNLLPGLAPLFQLLLRLRYATVFCFLTIVFSLCYWLIPNRQYSFLRCLKASLFTTSSWLLLSCAFSFCITFVARPSVLLLVLWLQACVVTFLYGMLLVRLLSEGHFHPICILKTVFSDPS